MPDFATARAAQERHFTNRERREVVVQHEALLGLALESLQPLHIFAGAQRGRHQCLRFTAGENRRAMRARQDPHFDPNIAYLVELAAVGTPVLLDDLLAE